MFAAPLPAPVTRPPAPTPAPRLWFFAGTCVDKALAVRLHPGITVVRVRTVEQVLSSAAAAHGGGGGRRFVARSDLVALMRAMGLLTKKRGKLALQAVHKDVTERIGVYGTAYAVPQALKTRWMQVRQGGWGWGGGGGACMRRRSGAGW